MTVEGHAAERKRELREGLLARNRLAGAVLVGAIKRKVQEYDVIDTGRLLNDVQAEHDVDGVRAGNTVTYARFPHNGHATTSEPPGYVEGRPYIIDGADDARPELRRVYGAGEA